MLEAKNQELQMEIDSFTAIKELNAEKSYSISYLCDKLEVYRATYYKWINRKPSNRQIANEQLAEQIIDMYNIS